MKIGKGRDRNLLLLVQLYYYLLVLGCVPGKLGGGSWFRAKGPVSLFASASSRSDGAPCDLRARKCEELDKLFSGGYLLVIGLPWLDCWWIG